LVSADLKQRLVGDGFHVAVAESIRRDSGSANLFRRGNTLLNLGADGAVVDKVPVSDGLCAMIDRNPRILELAAGVEMPNPQFCDLAGPRPLPAFDDTRGKIGHCRWVRVRQGRCVLFPRRTSGRPGGVRRRRIRC